MSTRSPSSAHMMDVMWIRCIHQSFRVGRLFGGAVLLQLGWARKSVQVTNPSRAKSTINRILNFVLTCNNTSTSLQHIRLHARSVSSTWYFFPTYAIDSPCCSMLFSVVRLTKRYCTQYHEHLQRTQHQHEFYSHARGSSRVNSGSVL